MSDAVYTNNGKRDVTLNFFYKNGQNIKSAQLACPFFTSTKPIQILIELGCSKINLLVRLCEATSYQALDEARKMEGVIIRYYTSRKFHAKFYILDNTALVGSANLTNSGLMSNRELSITIGQDDPRFDELPSFFDELWSAPPAAVLTEEAINAFKVWKDKVSTPELPDMTGLTISEPFNVHEKSKKISNERTFLETFRARYIESLIPAYRVVEEEYKKTGKRHPVFETYSFTYEMDRFLFWARHFTTDEKLHDNPLRQGQDLRSNIQHYIEKWFAEGTPYIDEDRIVKIDQLQTAFETKEAMQSVNIDEMTDMLQACAAFVEMLRFTKGGLDNHIKAFKEDNNIELMQKVYSHLAFGPDEFVKRIYDCIYNPNYKLTHWGQNCTLELFGWINKEGVPPFNGRIMKALRFLGFDIDI